MAGTPVSMMVRENASLLVTNTLKLTGSPQFASLRMEAAISGHWMRMRSCSEGEAGVFLGA